VARICGTRSSRSSPSLEPEIDEHVLTNRLGVQGIWYCSSVDEFAKRLVPDGLWEIVEPLIPVAPRRAQGGGIARADDRAVLGAIVFVLTSGWAWRLLPPTFGVSHLSAHRRFTEWSEVGLWAKLHRAVLDRLGAAGDIDWSRSIVDAASMRAKKEGR
jgi:transposase